MAWYAYINDDAERKIVNIQVTDRRPLNRWFADLSEQIDWLSAFGNAVQWMNDFLTKGYTVHIHIKPNPEEPPT